MTTAWTLAEASEDDVRHLAELLALKLTIGDTVALHGDLGAGKTTFARALVRALLGDPEAEVPSPTFSLVQTYDTPRLRVAHLDLYRLEGEGDAAELGAEELLERGAVIVEWPERAPSLGRGDRIDIRFRECADPGRRSLNLEGTGRWEIQLRRIVEIRTFFAASPWRSPHARYLQGDASPRAYARLSGGPSPAILMDAPRQPDGPPIRGGLPYSRIAHLAEDVRAFVAVAGALGRAGLSAPVVHEADLERGLLVLEDFGDRVFGAEIARGTSQPELWRAATETLAALHALPPPGELPLPDGTSYSVPEQDLPLLAIEVELLLDWYWPMVKGGPVGEDVRTEFLSLWNDVFERLMAEPRRWVLRDYHSPNLVWLPERAGVRRTGLLDFQDALVGPAAYDLVSLLEDARLDVPQHLETELLAHYLGHTTHIGLVTDREAFHAAYWALGAQRNTKILGIFARLAARDGKPGYLGHIPRIWGYLERALAHPSLAPLAAWYKHHLPDRPARS